MSNNENKKYLKGFAKRHKLFLSDVETFQKLGRLYGDQRAAFCNGDPHRDNPNPEDKNENARLWDMETSVTGQRMETMVKAWGFHHVHFCSLCPTIQETESDSSGTIHFDYGV